MPFAFNLPVGVLHLTSKISGDASMHLVLLQKDVLVGASLTAVVRVSAIRAVVQALPNESAQRIDEGSSVAVDRCGSYTTGAEEGARVACALAQVTRDIGIRERNEGCVEVMQTIHKRQAMLVDE